MHVGKVISEAMKYPLELSFSKVVTQLKHYEAYFCLMKWIKTVVDVMLSQCA